MGAERSAGRAQLGAGFDRPGRRVATVLPSIISAVAENDPAKAAQMTSRLSGDAQNAAANSVISQWASSDPQAAAAWAASFPDGTMRAQMFGNLINSLGKK